jgi:hypothetical protein
MEKTHKILNYCRWIVSDNSVVKYNVGDDKHQGWYVNEYGYWKYKIFYTYEVKRMVSNNHTVLGHTNEDYDFTYLREFLHSAYK